MQLKCFILSILLITVFFAGNMPIYAVNQLDQPHNGFTVSDGNFYVDVSYLANPLTHNVWYITVRVVKENNDDNRYRCFIELFDPHIKDASQLEFEVDEGEMSAEARFYLTKNYDDRETLWRFRSERI